MVGGKRINFDAVFMGIHGSPGVDGKLQGYFDLIIIPYTTSDAVSSALAANKRYTVAVAAFEGIHVAKSIHLFSHTPIIPDLIVQKLQLPVFVKPNKCGASIGMSKVNKPEELEASLVKAFKEDDQVLVEEFIAGREFTIAVFASRGEIITMPLTEIKTSSEFFNFESKCTAGLAEEITPAQVEEAIAEKIRATAKKVYQVFNCGGVVRIDFIYNEDKGAPYLLEINTVPGQSEVSIVPQQIRAMGWTLKEFYSYLIEDALTRKKQE